MSAAVGMATSVWLAVQRAFCTVGLVLFMALGSVISFTYPPFLAPDEFTHWRSGVARSVEWLDDDAERCSPAFGLGGRYDALQTLAPICDKDPINYGIALTYPTVLMVAARTRFYEKDGWEAMRSYFEARFLAGLLVCATLARFSYLALFRGNAPVPGMGVLTGVALSPLFVQSSFTITADLVTNVSILAFASLIVAGRRATWFDWLQAVFYGFVGAVTKYVNAPLFLALGVAAALVRHEDRRLAWSYLTLGLAATLACFVAAGINAMSGSIQPSDHVPGIDPVGQLRHLASGTEGLAMVVEHGIRRFFDYERWMEPLGSLDLTQSRTLRRYWRELCAFGVFVDLGALAASAPALLQRWRNANLAARTRASGGVLTLGGGALLGAIMPPLALYLLWTPVGAKEVIGVQQRYFYPSVFLVTTALLLTMLPVDDGSEKSARSTAFGLAVGGFMALLFTHGYLGELFMIVAQRYR